MIDRDGYVLSPDCAARKHRACLGDAWDDDTDEPTTCECECHTWMTATPDEGEA